MMKASGSAGERTQDVDAERRPSADPAAVVQPPSPAIASWI
jgi:hypothetical protein